MVLMSNSSLTIRLKENKGWEWAENIEQNEMVEKRKHLKKKKPKQNRSGSTEQGLTGKGWQQQKTSEVVGDKVMSICSFDM